MNITFVTALYETTRVNYDQRSYDDYQTWFSKTLEIPVPMIIYTDEKNRNIIDSVRANLPTKVFYTKFEEIPFYKSREKISEFITNLDRTKYPENLEYKCADYIPLVNSKFIWMRDAIHANYFNTDLFFWIDAGLSRFFTFDLSKPVFNNDLLFQIHTNKQMYLQMGREKELNDLLNGQLQIDSSIGKCINFIMAGFWGGHKEIVYDACELGAIIYEKEYVEKNRFDNEQTIFGYIIQKYKDSCFFIKNHPTQTCINYINLCNNK